MENFEHLIDRVEGKLKLLDMLMYERMLQYNGILKDSVEHDLMYLEDILDREIDSYRGVVTKNIDGNVAG